MTAREQMLEEEVKVLREEIRLLRLMNDNQRSERRILMEDTSTPRPDRVDAARIVVFQDESGWRWTASDTNGENVADSGDDGYVERGTAIQAAQDLFPTAEIVEMSPGVAELD